MHIFISPFLIAMLFFATILPTHAENDFDIAEGIEYEVLDQIQPVNNKDKVQVIEFFSYACPHCYNLEPNVLAWLKNKPGNIDFIQVPAIFNKQWEAFAKIYYTAEILNVADKVHPLIFEAIHGTGKKISSLDDIKTIFTSNGISSESFDNTLKSFAVANKIRKSKAMTKNYNIKSVPMIIVQGKYRTDSTLAHGHKNVFKVVDHIIKQIKNKDE
ncbi:MAG: thiol:disulfide interchange protein DsbA/DsbL [Pseudomonadota bacterium]